MRPAAGSDTGSPACRRTSPIPPKRMNEPTARFIREHRTDRLALMLAGRDDVDAGFALRQIEGWQKLRTKVPSWAATDELHYPPRLALEQCSGEAAARYKAEVAGRLLPDGGTMADLTGGLGVDFSFVARRFRRSTYVERQAELCLLARHNFPLLGLSGTEIVQADGTDFLKTMPPADLVFLDPARRDGAGRKTVFIEDCEPDVAGLAQQLLAKGRVVLVKCSPMLDLEKAVRTLGCVSEAHVFAADGECKELLLVMREDADPTCIFAAEGNVRFRFTRQEEAEACPSFARYPGTYLYEPGAAIMKAGAFRLIAVRFGLHKLHPNSHLYTSDRLVKNFPGRTFRIERHSGFGKRELRDFFPPDRRANLSVRNFPTTVAELRKRLKLKEGGTAHWFATTLADGNHILLDCHRI